MIAIDPRKQTRQTIGMTLPAVEVDENHWSSGSRGQHFLRIKAVRTLLSCRKYRNGLLNLLPRNMRKIDDEKA